MRRSRTTSGGFIGVDIFFVISGFLISLIILSGLEQGSFSFIEFYSRRIKRIFPALLLVLIVCYTFGWFILLPDELKQLGSHIAGGAGFVSNFMLWKESGYFDSAADTKPLLHLWSLGIEEQFYIFWPLFLWLARKKRWNVLGIILTVSGISFVLNVAEIHSNAVAVFYSPQTRFWELLTGSVLAYCKLYGPQLFAECKRTSNVWLRIFIRQDTKENNNNTLNNFSSLFGAMLIMAGMMVITKMKAFPGWWAVLPTFGTVLIIAAGPQSWFNRTVLSNRNLVWFGLISFPLYLWHWPLLSFVSILNIRPSSEILRMTIIIISIVLAWLTYRLIEHPVRYGKHGLLTSISLFVLMSLVGYAGYQCYETDGGSGYRFSLALKELTQFKHDYKTAYREGTCFLRLDQNYTAFSSCKSEFGGSKKPSLLLWGDSHAAHLYPGYQATFGPKYEILQRTVSSCPPILNIENDRNPACSAINDSIYKFILSERPDKVVLAAAWASYDWKKVEVTISKLHKIGIKNIDLIGPVPRWSGGLNKQLFIYYERYHRVPDRLSEGLNQDDIQLEPLLLNLSMKTEVNYVSPAKILCNASGCLTKLGDAPDSLITWDGSHLTEKGSRFLVSKFVGR